MPARHIRVVACRGDSRNAPENTLRAFDAAAKTGADELHADIRVTKDGVAVLCRDASLFRTTGKEALVRDLTLAEVQTLDAGINAADSKKPAPVPTLEEMVTRYLPKLPLQLELKEPGTVLPTVVLLQQLAAQGAFDRVLAVSVERSLLASLRMLDSRVRVGQILERRSSITLADVKLFGAALVLPYWDDAINRGYVDDAHKLGLAVCPWGAENLDAIKALVAAGSDILQYDNPAELLAYLKEAGCREEVPAATESKPGTNDKTPDKAPAKAQ